MSNNLFTLAQLARVGQGARRADLVDEPHLEAYSRRLLLMLVGVANRATDRIPRELSSNTRSLKDGPPRVPY
ncbi:MAG: hypothetical protein WBR33_12580, partial [Pseudonocardiaceae bacterium]